MNLRGKSIIIFSLVGLFVVVLFFCVKGKYETGKTIARMLGEKIELPSDNLFQQKNLPTILILVADTGECTTCTMQVYDWYLYKMDLEEHNLSCDITYILNDSVSLSSDITTLLGYYHLNYVTSANTFLNQNEKVRKSPIKTFLIDNEGYVQLVGSPIGNVKLWTLYKNKLRKLLACGESKNERG